MNQPSRAFILSLVALAVLAHGLETIQEDGIHVTPHVDERDVVVLDSSNFDDFVQANPVCLVEFYAPWCGHCKRLAPEYALAATDLKKSDPPVPIAKVNAEEERDLAQRFGVRGFPTLKVFHNGQPNDYQGGRTHKEIVTYMEKQAAPVVREVSHSDRLEELLNRALDNNDMLVAGFFVDGDDSVRSNFISVASELREQYTFVATSSEEVRNAQGFEPNSIVILSNFENPRRVLEGEPTTENIMEFVTKFGIPLIGVLDKNNAYRYIRQRLPIGVLYFDVHLKRDPSSFKYFTNRMRKIAAEFEGKVAFAVADSDEFREDMENSGIKYPGPGLMIELVDEEVKFLFEGSVKPFDMDGLKTWVQDVLDGKVEPYIISEPLPENNDGPVKVVVGRTFRDIVEDPEKNVLIEFYAPWCGHCKKLAAIYEELGEKFADSSKVVIAKIDATSNFFPSRYVVKGYPTIFLAKAIPEGSDQTEKTVVAYEGERDLESMAKWVRSESGLVKKKKKKASTDNEAPKEEL